jgi:hypothetical protein
MIGGRCQIPHEIVGRCSIRGQPLSARLSRPKADRPKLRTGLLEIRSQKKKMAPVKGPSVLHLFVHHRLLHHVMMIVMMHVHVVMHHRLATHSFLHHGLVLSDCGGSDCNRSQSRQHVRNLLHLTLLGGNNLSGTPRRPICSHGARRGEKVCARHGLRS